MMIEPDNLLKHRANVAITLMLLSMLGNAQNLFLHLGQYQDWQNMTLEAIVAATYNQQPSTLGMLQMVIALMSAITFIRWFRQAYRNLLLLGIQPLRYSVNWATWCFFIPIASLFLPYQIAKEIWLASNGRQENAPPGLEQKRRGLFCPG